MSAVQKVCFVISPIGEPGSDTRKRSDQILRHIIEPCLEECGYVAIRADQIGEPGIITNQVIQHLLDDPLVIADLSDRNPNVFYELAIRHLIRKPLVQMMRKGEPIPFDVAPMRIIQFDRHDLDSVAEARREIINQIRSVERDPNSIQSPISAAIDLNALKGSDRPEAQMLADLASSVAEIRATVATIAQGQRRRSGSAFVKRDATFYGGGDLSAIDHVVRDKEGKVWVFEMKSDPGFDSRSQLRDDDPCHCGSGKQYVQCHGSDRAKG